MIGALLERLGAAKMEEGPRATFYCAATESSILYRLLRGRLGAITLGSSVLFIGLDHLALPRMRRHELVHVRQYKELGAVRFLVAYLAAYFRARLDGKTHVEAYLGIPAEQEAYEHEDDETLPADP